MIAQLILMVAVVAFAALVRPEMVRSKGTTVALVALGIIMTLYAGLRDGDLVNDYHPYVDLYQNNPMLVEPTFTLIVFVVKNFLGDNVIVLFLIYAALAVALKLTAIRRLTPLVFMSIVIWLSDTFMLHELTQIRAGVATGFFLLAIKPLYERRGLRFFLLIVCATLFHVSALLAFPLWFMRPDRINKTFWIGLIVIGYAITAVGFDVFSLARYLPVPYVAEKATMYMTGGVADVRANPFAPLFLCKMAVTVFLLWRVERVAAHNRYAPLLIKIMIISFVSLLVFSTNIAAGLRFRDFFGTVQILLFPLLYYAVRPKVVAWVVLIALAALLFTLNIVRYELILPSP